MLKALIAFTFLCGWKIRTVFAVAQEVDLLQVVQTTVSPASVLDSPLDLLAGSESTDADSGVRSSSNSKYNHVNLNLNTIANTTTLFSMEMLRDLAARAFYNSTSSMSVFALRRVLYGLRGGSADSNSDSSNGNDGSSGEDKKEIWINYDEPRGGAVCYKAKPQDKLKFYWDEYHNLKEF
jgi:hypothetical protein